MTSPSSNNIEALDTNYDGYKFRSRLEARWAVFFNTLGIQYRYEPEGFELPSGGCYLPDFHLDNVSLRSMDGDGLWVEVKGQYSKTEWEQFAEFLNGKGENGAFLTGDITNEWGHESNYEAPRWDNFMIFVKCSECGDIKYEFSEGNYMRCGSCGGECSEKHPAVINAVETARSARFEHGEKPPA